MVAALGWFEGVGQATDGGPKDTVKFLTLGQVSWQVAVATDRQSSRQSHPANVGPNFERTHPGGVILASDEAVTAKMEEVGDLVVGREKALYMPR